MCWSLGDWVICFHCIPYPFPELVGFSDLLDSSPVERNQSSLAHNVCRRFQDETCPYGFFEYRIKRGRILSNTLVALSFLATCREQQAFCLALCLLSSPQNPLPYVDRAISFPEVKGKAKVAREVQRGLFSVPQVAPSPSELPSSHSFPRTDGCFWQGHSDDFCLAVAPTCEVAHLHLLLLRVSSGVGKVILIALPHHWEERSRHSLVEQRTGWVQTGRYKTTFPILWHHNRGQTGVHLF